MVGARFPMLIRILSVRRCGHVGMSLQRQLLMCGAAHAPLPSCSSSAFHVSLRHSTTASPLPSLSALEGLNQHILEKIPCGAPMSIQTLYGSLTPDQRRQMRKGGFSSLLSLIRALSKERESLQAIGVSTLLISDDGLRVVAVADGTNGEPPPHVLQLLNPPVTMAAPPTPTAMSSSAFASTSKVFTPNFNPASLEPLWEVFEPPLLASFTPPSTDAAASVSRSDRKVQSMVGSGHAGVFTAEMLVPYIPTFFVPLQEALHVLPAGYTAEHVQHIFTSTRAVEVVTLGRDSFVRLHGGYTVDLNGSDAADDRFLQYQPDPTLVDAFVAVFERPWKWYSLRQIVESVSEVVQRRLPFQQYQSLLYFAQMQHRFQFTPEGDGEVCLKSEMDGLTPSTTPTPKALNEIMRLLEHHQAVGLEDLCDSLSQRSLAQLVLYYPSMLTFVEAHASVLSYCDVRRVVELQSAAEARTRSGRSLEEKLEDALKGGEKRDVRKYRRRIAVMRNPDNPLIDRNRLIEEVRKFLPKNRSIAFRTLMRNLPPDIVDLFPADQISLFRTSPQFFQIFEFKTKGRLHIQHAGLPLPPGHLRTKYTDEELVHMCAMSLVDHSRLVVDIYSRLPWAAREIIRVQHKGLFHFLVRFPQYFAIVFKDGKQRYDSRGAMVSLLAYPPSTASMSPEVASTLMAPPALSDADGDDNESQIIDEVRQTAALLGYQIAEPLRMEEDDSHNAGGAHDDDDAATTSQHDSPSVGRQGMGKLFHDDSE